MTGDRRRRIFPRQLLFLLFTVAWLWPTAAFAASVTTPYPGVEVQPGKTVTFSLTVGQGASKTGVVQLSATGVPTGWTAQFQGNGYLVSEVEVAPQNPGQVTLQVKVPASASSGLYHLAVTASGLGGTQTLPITIRVASVSSAKPTLVAQYPALQGSNSSSFQFQLTLNNNAFGDENFALTAHAPQGWQVTFSPGFSTKQIGSIPVKSGASQTIDVNVTPPPSANTGTYNIDVAASAGSQQTVSVPLKVGLTGSYQLSVTTPSGQLDANVTAGKTTSVPILVKNTGTGPLTGISLSSSAPNNWNVSFAPSQVAVLAPGQQKQIDMQIKPDSKAIAGDYQVTATASTSQTTASQNFRVTVHTSTLWGLVGVLLVLVVAGGLVYLFRTLGRR